MAPYTQPPSFITGLIYKDYHFSPALLTASYFHERIYQLNSTSHDGIQTTILQHATVAHFDVYENWLLMGELVTIGKLRNSNYVVATPEQANAGYDNILSCCSLASVLGDNGFLDALTTQLVKTLRLANGFQSQFIRQLTRNRVEQVIEESGVGSGFFKLLAHAYARFPTVNQIRILVFSNYNVYFKSQVMQSLANLRAHHHIDGNAATDFEGWGLSLPHPRLLWSLHTAQKVS
jgi:hypothetical protein